MIRALDARLIAAAQWVVDLTQRQPAWLARQCCLLGLVTVAVHRHYALGQRDAMPQARDQVQAEREARARGAYALPAPPRPANPYGCHNRVPTAAPDCQYTLSDLGRVDPRCVGCRWRAL